MLIPDLGPPVDVAETITSLFSSSSQVQCIYCLLCGTPEDRRSRVTESHVGLCGAVLDVCAHTNACVCSVLHGVT